MARFKLLSADIVNYLSVKNQQLQFPDKGLVYVQGDMGAGKTALGEALARTMSGIDTRYSRAVQCVGDTGKGFDISVAGDFGDRGLVIKNGYKSSWSKTGEGLLWHLNEEKIQYPSLDICRDKLSELLNISQMEAKWCVFLDGEDMKWDNLPQSEATNFLLSLFQAPKFDAWRKKAKEKLDAQDLALNELNTKRNYLTVLIGQERASWDFAWNIADQNELEAQIEQGELEIAKTRESIEANKFSQGSVVKPDQSELNRLKVELAGLSKDEIAQAEFVLRTAEDAQTRAINDAVSAVETSELTSIDADINKLDTELKVAKAEEAQLRTSCQTSRSKLTGLQIKLSAAERTLETIANSCPTCGLKFVGAALERAKQAESSALEAQLQAKQELSAAKIEASQLEESLKECEAKITRLKLQQVELKSARGVAYAAIELAKEQAEVQAVNKSKLDIDAASLQVKLAKEAYASKLSEINKLVALEERRLAEHDSIKTLKLLKDEAVGLQVKLNDQLNLLEKRKRQLASLLQSKVSMEAAQARVAKMESEVQALHSEISTSELIHTIIKYWYTAAGPSGLTNLILEEIVPIMNLHSELLSNELTNGQLMVKWATTAAKASGEEVAKLTWSLVGRHSGTSKGESSLIRFMIASTLSQCAGTEDKCNWRWYDEVTGGQPSHHRMSTFAWMKRQAQEKNLLIFLVDHHPEAAQFADYILRAELDQAKTTNYSWE